MRLAGALATTGSHIESEDFLRCLKEECPGLRTFLLNPPPGKPMKAGVDWVIVLNSTASAITIARALWKAYQRHIAPLREKQKESQTGLFLMLQSPGDRPAQMLIRKDFNTQKQFTDEFLRTFAGEDEESPCEDLVELDLWREVK